MGKVTMKAEKKRSKFSLCVRNDGADDLEPRKLYQVLSDPGAVREGYVRVIDESGDDYLFPSTFFAAIDLPNPIRRAVLTAA